jgi:hypothetical protein
MESMSSASSLIRWLSLVREEGCSSDCKAVWAEKKFNLLVKLDIRKGN